jgi:hypothetical protein
MHAILEQRMTEILAIQLSVQRDLELLQAQLPLLERIQFNTTLPTALQQSAGQNRADSANARLESAHLANDINAWIRRANTLRDTIRHSDQRYPSTAQAQTEYARLDEDFQTIRFTRGFIRGLHIISTNLNLIDQVQAHGRSHSMAPSDHTTTYPPGPFPVGHGGRFGGVMAADAAPLATLKTGTDAYNATQSTHAHLFAQGARIQGDANHRRYTFFDLSRVDIQAHQPVLTTSDESDAFVAAAAVVGLAGGSAGGPVSSIFFGIGATTAVLAVRHHDAAWQGYTAHYYSNLSATTPWGTQYFYGWKRSPDAGSPVAINGTQNPAQFPNFADKSHNYVWFNWRHGNAEPRPPTLPSARQARANHQVDSLIQNMNAFAAPVSAATSSLQTQANIGFTQETSMLMAATR